MALDQVTDTGTPEVTPPAPLNERVVDGPGSGRGELRKQLESSVETERKGRETREAKRPAARVAPNHQEAPKGEDADLEEQVLAEADKTPKPEDNAPEAFTKEAKAEWAQTPANVRAAILKREQDVVAGVGELKKRYAEIDQVLAPRMDVIRQHGHTPAQAVNQLFAWFDALAANPAQAFPALAQSFRFDLRTLLGQAQATAAKAPAQPGAPADPAAEIPPAVASYISSLEKKLDEKLGGLTQQFSQQFTQQSMNKTQEILSNWSKDKPYFEDVRGMMSHLIGSGAVPPLPNGGADLDKAYDMALYALPDVRNKVLAEKKQAELAAFREKREKEKNLQQGQANAARRASAGALIPGAPGEPVAPGKKNGKGKSVRESLMEAREELSGT